MSAPANLDQVIHDLRNPLNNISMYAELGKMQAQQGATAEKLLQTFETIVAQCQRCSSLLEELKQNTN